MPVVAFPPEVMSSLLASLESPPSSMSPFAFLQKKWKPLPLTNIHDWMSEKGLLDENSALTPSWQESLEMAAQPSNNLVIFQKSGDRTAALSHLLTEEVVVVATFDQKNCLLSTGLSLDSFVEGVLKRLPLTGAEETPPRPWMTEHQVLLLVGALVKEGLGAAPERLRKKVLFASMPGSLRKLPSAPAVETANEDEGLRVSRAEEVMALIVGDEDLARALVMDLMLDNVLLTDEEECYLHPEVEPWANAIAEGIQLEWVLTEFDSGEEDSIGSVRRLLFFGEEEQGCVAFPASREGSVVFARPHSEVMSALLRSFLKGTQGSPSLAGFGGGLIRG